MGFLNFLKKLFKRKKKKRRKKPARKVKPLRAKPRTVPDISGSGSRASKKKTVKKKAVKKPLKKELKSRRAGAKPRTVTPKGGSGARASKPLKEPKEKEVGVIIHHYGKISVGIIKLKAGLKVGDKIHIKGAHDDFSQTIKSMQLNHQDIPSAKKGDEIGIKVTSPVHENDRVYKIPLT